MTDAMIGRDNPGTGRAERAAMSGVTAGDEDNPKFRQAVERFDAANSQDPNRATADGREEPEALLYGRRMSQWLKRLAPDASEPLRLAVRCQHLCRWMIPRETYPMTRTGYHRWRTDLARFHADKAGQILREVGYDEATVGRVQSLVRKEGLKSDPETQTLEDVACLVFLENYFPDFSKRHDEMKVLGILRRTWGKMSPRGREAALGLDLRPEDRRLIEKALTGPPTPSGPAGP